MPNTIRGREEPAAVGRRETVRHRNEVVPHWRSMNDSGWVTAADVQLMQGLAQRVTAVRPDLINADASFGELAWIWGKGHARWGATWPRREPEAGS